MKFVSTVLPLAAAASLGSALVVPEVADGETWEQVRDVAEDVVQEVSEDASAAATAAIAAAKQAFDKLVDGVGREVTREAANRGEAVRFAPLETTNREEFVIPHRYMVVFKQGASADQIGFHKELVSQAQLQNVATLRADDPFFVATSGDDFDAEITAKATEGGILDSFDVGGALRGYIGYFTDAVVDLIRMNPLVEFVERDSLVFSDEFDTQNGAPWGLSRISHREKLTLGSFNKYLYDDDAGKGVTAYVIDTGVNVEHKDFDGRATWGKTIPDNDLDSDGNGHGTHCAGTIGSKHYGVAKNADIVAVKVLRSNGSGTMSDVVKGVEYAAQSHQKAVKENKKGFKGSTANMSLGGGKSPALDLAVNAAVKAGLHFAVAAGNENQDACNTSPAAAENAITVGASTLADDRAYFSNWGKCVDIFAPGLNVLSTYIGSDTATATLSGTSMASPHVAGLLTYFLSLQPDSDSEFFQASSGVTPAQLKKKLIAFSTKNALGDLPDDTANYLIYNGGGQDLGKFWGKDEASTAAEPESGSDHATQSSFADQLESLIDSLDAKTDVLYDEVRGLFDNLNII
ncbi:LAMI_0B08064g1_1 [Lachancea mirantina]|uniref:LAMI_0B08064g1_1 n=1 Tax=Lachancea mirantina TaxID=1230905 RepID=A0A1G4IXM2_9SACH|nr:LAMI_0B08064g1_1 [Lachancea mirantina]